MSETNGTPVFTPPGYGINSGLVMLLGDKLAKTYQDQFGISVSANVVITTRDNLDFTIPYIPPGPIPDEGWRTIEKRARYVRCIFTNGRWIWIAHAPEIDCVFVNFEGEAA